MFYNVHSTIHIPDDYLKHGNIERVSDFKFENYNAPNISDVAIAGNRDFPELSISSHCARSLQFAKLRTNLYSADARSNYDLPYAIMDFVNKTNALAIIHSAAYMEETAENKLRIFERIAEHWGQ